MIDDLQSSLQEAVSDRYTVSDGVLLWMKVNSPATAKIIPCD